MKASLKCSLAQVLIASILSIACETHSIPKKIPTKPTPESGTDSPVGDSSGGGGSESGSGPLTWQVSDLQGNWATECLDFGGVFAKYILLLNAGSFQFTMCQFPSEIECNSPSGITGTVGLSPTNSITLYPNELKEESVSQGKNIITQDGFYFYSLMSDNSSILFWGDPDSKDKMVYQIISDPLNVLSGGILDYDTLNGYNLDFYQRDLSQLTLDDFWDYELFTSHRFSSLAEIGCSY